MTRTCVRCPRRKLDSSGCLPPLDRGIGQDLFLRHPGGTVAENVVDSDPHLSDARIPAPHIGVYGYPLPVIHAQSLRRKTSARFKLLDARAYRPGNFPVRSSTPQVKVPSIQSVQKTTR